MWKWDCNLGQSGSKARTFFQMEMILSENHKMVRNPHCRKHRNSFIPSSFLQAIEAFQPTSPIFVKKFELSLDIQHKQMFDNIKSHTGKQFAWSPYIFFSMWKNKYSISHCQSMQRPIVQKFWGSSILKLGLPFLTEESSSFSNHFISRAEDFI